MSQTPQTPAGWYPAEGGERWWDGNAWSEHRRPAPVAPPGYPPSPYAAGHPGSPYAPPPPNHTTRNVLIVIGVVFVLLVGGCFALVALAGQAVDEAIDEATAADQEPGGPDNPLAITPGEPFDVSGFSYAGGWVVGADELDLLEISGLTVTNRRERPDDAIVEIDFLQGERRVASADCSATSIDVGQTVTLTCFSGDALPAAYDQVTINDAY